MTSSQTVGGAGLGFNRMAPFGAVMALAAATAAPTQEQDGWLNVRDCGASGSEFSTTAVTTAGAKQIAVKDVGDFRVGQGLMVSKCNPRLVEDHLWGPKQQYVAGSGGSLKDRIDFRGYDETAGAWTVYILDIERSEPVRFRWSTDISRTWKTDVPITYDWQPLQGGLEVRFNKGFDWTGGWTASFSARDQLATVIEKIDGNVLTLRDATPKAATDAVVRHSDTEALQAAIGRALKEKRNLFFPAGRYCLARGLNVDNPAGICLEGVDGVNTVLDLSEGSGACVSFHGGTEGNIRNFTMIGNMGFAERDQCGSMGMHGCGYLWGQDLKTSFATATQSTERVYVENVHARRMSLEAFWSGDPKVRMGNKPEAPQHTKAITYLRCSAVDCGRNAFNNNDLAENTSILYCRIVDVGGCAWEGASRFVKFVGNYIRNSGTVAIGNVSDKSEDMEILPSGQHIVSDNVFESNVPYGGCAIRTAMGCTPVVISNNLFINFNSSAIELRGPNTYSYGLPASDSSVIGNIFDMTCVEGNSKPRIAVESSQSGVIIANNQIYARGATDPKLTGIVLREPGLNVTVHDNLVRGCAVGLLTTRAVARVKDVVDKTTFVMTDGGIPFAQRRSHRYQGWSLVWLAGNKPAAVSTIDTYDPEQRQFKLREPHEMKVGETFEVFPPYGANWNIHDNTFDGCLTPVTLDSYGSATTLFKDNTLTRGQATGVKEVVAVKGRFLVLGNLFHGFDEAGCTALALYPDRFGQPLKNLYRDNCFDNCANVVGESQGGLWEAALKERNTFTDCGSVPKQP